MMKMDDAARKGAEKKVAQTIDQLNHVMVHSVHTLDHVGAALNSLVGITELEYWAKIKEMVDYRYNRAVGEAN